MASEMDAFDLEAPGESETPKEDSAEGEMTDDKLGLALKRAISSGNGAAICEMVRKITDSY
jgi:hypothetical protein